VVTYTDSEKLLFARSLVQNIPDPEIPVVTLEDLGILRDVTEVDSEIVVVLTPTYSGCPATEAIRSDVKNVLAANGFLGAQVRVTLSPAWSSDWITPQGRQKLFAYGITPPATSADGCLTLPSPAQNTIVAFKAPSGGIRCPRCVSVDTALVSQFGSTPCKALYKCRACKEPFDYFKPY
jgi:ring-1,2-phenylacetyl-CoA epoxidase subunit PaaD